MNYCLLSTIKFCGCSQSVNFCVTAGKMYLDGKASVERVSRLMAAS